MNIITSVSRWILAILAFMLGIGCALIEPISIVSAISFIILSLFIFPLSSQKLSNFFDNRVQILLIFALFFSGVLFSPESNTQEEKNLKMLITKTKQDEKVSPEKEAGYISKYKKYSQRDNFSFLTFGAIIGKSSVEDVITIWPSLIKQKSRPNSIYTKLRFKRDPFNDIGIKNVEFQFKNNILTLIKFSPNTAQIKTIKSELSKKYSFLEMLEKNSDDDYGTLYQTMYSANNLLVFIDGWSKGNNENIIVRSFPKNFSAYLNKYYYPYKWRKVWNPPNE